MTEWVSTKDRLPKEGELVLITICGYYGNYVLIACRRCIEENKFEWYTITDEFVCEDCGVSAWQPLPKPYNEVKQNG